MIDYTLCRRNDLQKRYFPMPNEIFSFGLCAGELAVYMYLMKCENKTYQCWPSYKTIGSATGMSKNTVKKYVASLEEKCFIHTEYTHRWTRNGKKLNGNLLYTMRPLYAARDYYNEKAVLKAAREAERRKAQKRLAKLQKEQSKHTA